MNMQRKKLNLVPPIKFEVLIDHTGAFDMNSSPLFRKPISNSPINYINQIFKYIFTDTF